MIKLIAEFCQNHNGNIDILAEMVEKAAKSGATHAKIQTIYSKNLSFRPEFEEGVKFGNNVLSIKRPYKAEYERLKKLELSNKSSKKFISLCLDNGLVPMTTCFSRASIDEIYETGFKSIKVASYDCASYQLIRELVDKFDELIVSTGGTYDDEIEKTTNILKDSNYSLLHCVTLYPTPLSQMNLERMLWLKKFTNNIGLSEHTLFSRDSIQASMAAIAIGAKIIERHFTILPESETKDGPVSINPKALKELSRFAKMEQEERLIFLNKKYPAWKIMMGSEKRKLSHEEILNRNYYRGRFASPRKETENGQRMIFNWEETSLK